MAEIDVQRLMIGAMKTQGIAHGRKRVCGTVARDGN